MKTRIPSKKVCKEFHITYELKGAQKGIDVLTRYYGIRSMKIILDGRRVGNGDEACYDRYVACFTKRGVNRFNVLHELYHHIAHIHDLEMSESREEREANRFAKVIMHSN